MSDDAVQSIGSHPVHLGLGGTAFVLPAMDGSMEWYGRYGELYPDDGPDGRLVSMYTFTESWDSWEVHPTGHEVVLCVAGSTTLHQELPSGEERAVTLTAGEYAINEPGTWHTADVDSSATVVFITSGEGTRHRPR